MKGKTGEAALCSRGNKKTNTKREEKGHRRKGGGGNNPESLGGMQTKTF